MNYGPLIVIGILIVFGILVCVGLVVMGMVLAMRRRETRGSMPPTGFTANGQPGMYPPGLSSVGPMPLVPNLGGAVPPQPTTIAAPVAPQPSAPAAAQAPATVAASAPAGAVSVKAYARVMYMQGFGVPPGQNNAILMWTAEDRLVLDLVDPVDTPVARLFDAPIAQVGVSGNAEWMSFLVGSVRYSVNFAMAGTMVAAASWILPVEWGIGQEILRSRLTQESGVREWAAALNAAGPASFMYITPIKSSTWIIVTVVTVGFCVIVGGILLVGALGAFASR